MKKNNKNSVATYVDMSSRAVTQRLKDVNQLYQLGEKLKTAKRIGKLKDIRPDESNKNS